MALWIVRFVPRGGMQIDAFYRTEEKARAAYATAKAQEGAVEITDDFGVTLSIDRSCSDIILTNTDMSAAIQAALHTANQEASATYGLTHSMIAGSSLQ